MGYLSIAELKARYGTSEVLVAASEADDSDISVQAAIDDEASLMDSYLKAAKYTLPINPVPDVLKRCNAELALYHLSLSIGPYTDEKKVRHDEWMKWLLWLVTGEVQLDVPKDDGLGELSSFIVATSSPRLFTRFTQRGIN